MPDWETDRFEDCSEILFSALHAPDYKIKEAECGLIYGDISLNKDITVLDRLLIKYEGTQTTNNIKVQVLTIKIPDNLDVFNIPSFSEAIACLLSFSFRSRFIGSRHWCHLKEGRVISPPMDVFYRLSSVIAGPMAVHPMSPDSIGEGIGLFDWLMERLREIHKKDFDRMIRSFRLYQLSLLTYSIDIGLAYSLLVSSVDNLSCRLYVSEVKALAGRFVRFIEENLPTHSLTSFDSRAWEEDRWMESITPWKHSVIDSYKEQYETHGEKALESLKGIFNAETIGKINEAFTEKRELSVSEKQAYDHALKHWYIYRFDSKLMQKELPSALRQIYNDVRSQFYHRGKSPSQSALDRYEMARLKPKFTENNRIKWRREIPSFYYFERIAHDSIMGYLSKL